MTNEIIEILNIIKERFTDNSDLAWTSCETAKELRDELDIYINQLKNGDISCLDNLNMHFWPTSTFQEHSMQNGWSDEYLKLAEKFDKIYEEMKN